MITTYQQSPGELIPQSGRRSQAFPSGLLRVEQIFLCPWGSEADHRETLASLATLPGDSAPSIDPLIIFPYPAETRLETGFTEFAVTAYGRTNDEGTVALTFREEEVVFRYEVVNVDGSTTSGGVSLGTARIASGVHHFVVPAGTVPSFVPPPEIRAVWKSGESQGQPVTSFNPTLASVAPALANVVDIYGNTPADIYITLTAVPFTRRIDRTNYGDYDEYSVAYDTGINTGGPITLYDTFRVGAANLALGGISPNGFTLRGALPANASSMQITLSGGTPVTFQLPAGGTTENISATVQNQQITVFASGLESGRTYRVSVYYYSAAGGVSREYAFSVPLPATTDFANA